MEIQYDFKANYLVSTDAELPPTGNEAVTFKLTGSNPHSGVDGPVLMISPVKGQSWLASFASGYRSSGAVNGIFSTPDPDTLCVVASGAGYWVHAFKKIKFDINAFPIRQVWSITEPPLLVFADFSRLAAYDRAGLKWRTDPLVSDKLLITGNTASFIECEGLDAASGELIKRKVDLASGVKLP